MPADVTLPPVRPVWPSAQATIAAADRGPAPRPVPPVGRAELPAEQTVQPGSAGRGAALTTGHRPAGANGPDLVALTLYQDAASQRYVAVIRDKGTGEVIEQVPSDRLLQVYADLRERFERVEIEIEV